MPSPLSLLPTNQSIFLYFIIMVLPPSTHISARSSLDTRNSPGCYCCRWCHANAVFFSLCSSSCRRSCALCGFVLTENGTHICQSKRASLLCKNLRNIIRCFSHLSEFWLCRVLFSCLSARSFGEVRYSDVMWEREHNNSTTLPAVRKSRKSL